MSAPVYTTAVIGLGRMSRGHIRAFQAHPRFDLVGGCDPGREARAAFADATGLPEFGEVTALMETLSPEVVAIVAPDAAHAPLTLQLAGFQPKAILGEKPMAPGYREACDMVEACESRGVELIINHQRRLLIGPAARGVIDAGGIGDLMELEGRCAGDLIADGTHVVDSLMAIGGDEDVGSVLGMVDLGPPESRGEQRYGRAREVSAAAIWTTAANVRYSVYTGALSHRIPYQSYRVRGSAGELWHPGGSAQPLLYLNDGTPGTHRAALEDNGWFLMPEPCDGGPWRCVNPDDQGVNPMDLSLDLLAKRLDGDPAPHPLNGARTLKVQEVLNAAYLSARDRRAVPLPLPRDTGFALDDLVTS